MAISTNPKPTIYKIRAHILPVLAASTLFTINQVKKSQAMATWGEYYKCNKNTRDLPSNRNVWIRFCGGHLRFCWVIFLMTD